MNKKMRVTSLAAAALASAILAGANVNSNVVSHVNLVPYFY